MDIEAFDEWHLLLVCLLVSHFLKDKFHPANPGQAFYLINFK
jgi:hypothetical protein